MANVLSANRINVRVSGNTNLHVSVSNTSSTLLNSSVPVTLKNNPVLSLDGGGANTLEELNDVAVVQKLNGSTLSYSESSNKYEIKIINLDGGIF